jgi:hypothetical protein
MMAGRPMRHIVLVFATLLAGAADARVVLAEDGQPQSAAPATGGRTGKERLGDKGSDEQRIDDCKVPKARRSRDRPANCQSVVHPSHYVP